MFRTFKHSYIPGSQLLSDIQTFLAGNQLYELKTHRRGSWGCKKKHCNFRLETVTFEPRHENKTCSACREWLNERLKECESEKEWEWDSEREWEWESVRASFEHRDENKSCSACQEWLNERLNECESEKEWDSEWECDLVPSFCLTFRHFLLDLSYIAYLWNSESN